jgi:hypothetical protein
LLYGNPSITASDSEAGFALAEVVLVQFLELQTAAAHALVVALGCQAFRPIFACVVVLEDVLDAFVAVAGQFLSLGQGGPFIDRIGGATAGDELTA